MSGPDPFDIGYRAWHDGFSADANPYDFELEAAEFLEWEEGFNKAGDDNDQFGVGA